jgi:integrase
VGDITQATADSLCASLCRPGAAPATRLRQVIGPLRAVLMHAARRQWCDPPMLEVPAGAAGARRTRWLTPPEYHRLVAAAAPHLRPLLVFLVCTGARLGEALALDWRAVDLRHARASLPETKAGARDRLVPLPPAAIAALGALAHREGRVFRPPPITRGGAVVRQPLAYRDTAGTGGGQIATAWRAACRRAGLLRDSGRRAEDGSPVLEPDATPHTLRHTWASWRYAMHRDLLRLREEGGWGSTRLCERYAKLVPAGLVPEVLAAWGLAAAGGEDLTQAAAEGR